MSLKIRLSVASILACVALVPGLAISQDFESATIRIDSSVTQPVGTGLIPTSADDVIVLIAEGGLRVPPVHSTRLTEGWFGPNGVVKFARSGQPVGDDMPYGCLLQTFTGTVAGGAFAGEGGMLPVFPTDVGNELELGVNMSDTDLTNSEGAIIVHAVLLRADYGLGGSYRISAQTGQPVSTGLVVADASDKFIILPYGGMRPIPGQDPFSDGWFGPEGGVDLVRGGQQLARAPYGSVIGTFTSSLPGGFYAGAKGSWNAQPVDVGDELLLGVNMSDTDLAGAAGAFQVLVIHLPGTPPSSAEEDETLPSRIDLGRSFPNPMNPAATIRYALPSSERVHLRILDANGRLIRTLVDEERPAGAHEIVWDGTDGSGGSVASGTYFYQLSTTNGTKTNRIVVAR